MVTDNILTSREPHLNLGISERYIVVNNQLKLRQFHFDLSVFTKISKCDVCLHLLKFRLRFSLWIIRQTAGDAPIVVQFRVTYHNGSVLIV